ncbi:MAG: hypothetical protein HKN23_12890 [Verrucomicrobiales bacterium]|nr:hypothetical protein [Verrucomicrobiales bacterium]
MSDNSQVTAEDVQERAGIDRSVRFPVMFFFTSAAVWLFVATLFGFLSALKLAVPALWADCQFLGYGRLFPAHMTALVYGWAMQAGIGVMLWLVARLTRVEMTKAKAVIVAGHVWNFAVGLAVFAIWIGKGRSIPWLDFPGWMWMLFALSYLMMVVWVIPMFRVRRTGDVYISEYYVIGAAVWFPWIFITANVLINRGAAPVMAAGAAGWFVTNLIYFWFAPIALAVAYYIVPKIAGRPIFSYPLAKLGFWTLAILAGWTGFQRFMGGPFPAWMPALSGAATLFILIAVVATCTNLLMTLKGRQKLWEYSPSLRFTMFGMLMFAIYGVLAGMSSFFSVGKVLQFSHFLVGLDTLAVYGFFSMTIFGAMYFIVPRVTGCEWVSGGMIRWHFWFSAYGILTLVGVMLVGGLAQGGNMADLDQRFAVSVGNSQGYVIGRICAWFLIGISNLWFVYQMGLMFLGKGRKSEGPTLIHGEPGKSAEAAAGLNPENA